MTRHPDHDTLLRYALETLSAKKTAATRKHVDSCGTCRSRVGQLEREIGKLGSVRPELSAVVPPLPRATSALWPVVWLRAAAILAAGFLLGFAAAQFLRSRPVDVVQQYLVPQPPQPATALLVACKPVDLRVALR